MFVENLRRVLAILADPMRMVHVLQASDLVAADAHGTHLLAQVVNTRIGLPPPLLFPLVLV